ncbi:E3 ubiquitin-protein ligase CIP8-like [Impatiens glandulifera]|uniref:E3 ubiquitin-protein ligase CIP8-like n=1 Tax=Impatiens glandulifera TaxID=253017 RepID=UPI001FB0EA95|nr:E3 ubiquitin-protein ligase CIP8-like [Impatiens glandulifera]
MADDAPQQQQQQFPTSSAESVSLPDSLQYWCHHCDKRVSVETLTDISDVICHECKSGFVESIASAPFSISDPIDQPSLSNQFLQVLRLMAQAAREDDEPPPPPPPPSNPADPSDDDYLRIELNGWNNDDEEEVELQYEDGLEEDGSEDENEEIENLLFREIDESRRRRREVLRLRLRDFAAARVSNRRNRMLDWAEILMGLEDQTIQLRLQVPEMNDYVGNPEDYVDAAGYEALLQNLADADGGGRKGAPPASKSAIVALERIVITSQAESVVCAICKDSVTVGEIAKKLPCAHVYHEDCIIPWLGSRNSCPVCRYELDTDDPEYEESRKKKKQPIITNEVGGPSNSSG